MIITQVDRLLWQYQQVLLASHLPLPFLRPLQGTQEKDLFPVISLIRNLVFLRLEIEHQTIALPQVILKIYE